jgi:hypothetical protein
LPDISYNPNQITPEEIVIKSQSLLLEAILIKSFSRGATIITPFVAKSEFKTGKVILGLNSLSPFVTKLRFTRSLLNNFLATHGNTSKITKPTHKVFAHVFTEILLHTLGWVPSPFFHFLI